jgi:hypothetical protein
MEEELDVSRSCCRIGLDISRKLDRNIITQVDESQESHKPTINGKGGMVSNKKISHDLDFTTMGINDVIARLRAGAKVSTSRSG